MKKFTIYPNDTAINANSKASTFARHTKPRHKANLAKELAFPHTGHTLLFVATQTDTAFMCSRNKEQLLTMIAQSPALWIFEEDISNRSGLDWLSAHISLGKPLHRYEGTLTINENNLLLEGFDNRQKVDTIFEILKGQIEQLYHGFDETFTALETRSLGLTWYPLRLTFYSDDESKNVYLIINYRFGKTDNLEYFEFLKQWVT